jgi:glycosyltransferase involved in cell wall biosynthesis
VNAPPSAICLVYDRLYPASIGGAERWYRLLAERLAEQGHHVTYLTSTHRETTQAPTISGVRVIPLHSQSVIYGRRRRRMLPILSFALAVGRHLFLHGRDYDVVHTSAMLSSTALIAALLAPLRGYRLILDWWEVWTRHYWRDYLGPIAGITGWLIQRQVARLRHQPIAYSKLHAERLRHFRRGEDIPIFRGLLDESWTVSKAIPASPLVVSAGRLIPEKQMDAIPQALAIARERLPDFRAAIFGAGPDGENVRQAVAGAGLDSAIDLPGFVSDKELRAALQRALCLVLLSRREGYGLIVAEATALGTPCVVLRHADSAASELIVEGVNGFLVESADGPEVATAILRVYDGGQALRQRTLRWFHSHADDLTAGRTVVRLVSFYRGDAPEGSSTR